MNTIKRFTTYAAAIRYISQVAPNAFIVRGDNDEYWCASGLAHEQLLDAGYEPA